VGWSLTGLSTQYHAIAHPEDVSGAVLVDSSPFNLNKTRTTESISKDIKEKTETKNVPPVEDIIEMLRQRSGPDEQEQWLRPYAESLYQVRANDRSGEIKVFLDTIDITREAVLENGLGDLPLIVLSAGVSDFPVEVQEEMKASHQMAASASSRGKMMVVDGGSHMMTLDRPDAIVDAIKEVLVMTGQLKAE